MWCHFTVVSTLLTLPLLRREIYKRNNCDFFCCCCWMLIEVTIWSQGYIKLCVNFNRMWNTLICFVCRPFWQKLATQIHRHTLQFSSVNVIFLVVSNMRQTIKLTVYMCNLLTTWSNFMTFIALIAIIGPRLGNCPKISFVRLLCRVNNKLTGASKNIKHLNKNLF